MKRLTGTPDSPGMPDMWLVAIVSAILVLGLIVCYSASSPVGLRNWGTATYFIKRQVLWLLIGLVGSVALALVDYHVWQRWPIPGLVILVPVAALLGLWVLNLKSGGEQQLANRWLLGGSVQPSELAKPAIILYMAAWLASKEDKVRHFGYGLVPFGIILSLIAGLAMVQPDVSTAFLITAVAMIMFFIAGGDIKQLAVLCLIGGLIVTPILLKTPYVSSRLADFTETWLDPLDDPASLARQSVRATAALMSGGLTGVGLGGSKLKASFGPMSHTDFVLAVAGEELGFLGVMLFIMLFAAFAYRGYRIALLAPDTFGCLIAVGVTSWIIVQAAIHAGVAVKLVPVTGMPLPLVSYGGSAMVTALASIGLLINISRYAVRESGQEHAYIAFGRRDGRARLSRAHRS